MFFKCVSAIVTVCRLCFAIAKAILGFLLLKGVVIILYLVRTPNPNLTGMH